MRSPALSELPPPPGGKIGYPWTEASLAAPEMPDSPRITIVTPSFNQGPFLEETIRSVLLQGYPDLEYIVMDGGSIDESVEIIRRYAPWLAHWTSAKDGGQSDAINRGFARATGSLGAWLNSDDRYEPGALNRAATFHAAHPEFDMLYGSSRLVDGAGRAFGLNAPPPYSLAHLLMHSNIPQHATFFTLRAWRAVGGLDESLHYAMDYDLWLRLAARFRIARMDAIIASHRKTAGTKTVEHPERIYPDILASLARWFAESDPPPEARALEGRALGMVHLRAGVNTVRAGDAARGAQHLAEAFRRDPSLRSEPERFLQVVVNYGRGPDAAEAERSVRAVFDCLPPEARALARWRERAVRRARLLQWHAHPPPPARRRMLAQLPHLAPDWRWLCRRPVPGIVWSLLAGTRRV